MVNLYVIRDKLTEKVGPVMDIENDLAAIRTFRMTLKNHEFPDDFELINIGLFDSETLEVSALPLRVVDTNMIIAEVK